MNGIAGGSECNMCEWSNKWEMEFNANKCHILRMGKGKNRPLKQYKMVERDISVVKEKKDPGVTVQDSLTPENTNRIFGDTYRLL